jgi:16S rRNA (cytidine1402-2'-O)-methyltransferase
VPGASSALAAFSVAGDSLAQGFRFVGFLPSKGAQRRLALDTCLETSEASVLFEAPHRMQALAAELAERCAATPAAQSRTVTLCRELTKQFEEVATLPAEGLPAWLAADPQRTRGEFVLVVHAQNRPTTESTLPAGALRTLGLLMSELPLKQAASLAAQISGAPRNALYDAALSMRKPANEKVRDDRGDRQHDT